MTELPPRTTDAPQPERIPSASLSTSVWRHLVWAIPLTALLIVLYLGLRALSDRGVQVVVTFPSAAGARARETKVIYRGVEIGRVTDIAIGPDRRRVDMTLKLDRRMLPALNSNTKFWLIGANPSAADLTSLKAVLAGVSVGMAPGQDGHPTRRFEGLEQAPVIEPGTQGASYTLLAAEPGPVRPGSTVLYRGQEIGKVTHTEVAGVNAFRVSVFIYKPYEALIRPGAQFWSAGALQVSLNGPNITTSLGPAEAVLAGAVNFDLPDAANLDSPSPPGSNFILYKNQADAQAGLSGPSILYVIYFKGPVGDVAIGGPVKLMGYPVGEVRDNRLLFDLKTGLPYGAIVAAIYSRKLGLPDRKLGSDDLVATRVATDAKLNQLLAEGFRVRLKQSPPLIGARLVSFESADRGPAQLGAGGAYPVIPSESASSDAEDLTTQADQILRKVNHIPIEAIGADVRQITGRLRALVSSPQLTDSLDHLDSTLSQLDRMLAEVKPQVGPLVTKLNQAADELNGTAVAARALLSGEGASQDASLPEAIQQLTEAARSIRSLSDYLNRHPEAVIKGKASERR